MPGGPVGTGRQTREYLVFLKDAFRTIASRMTSSARTKARAPKSTPVRPRADPGLTTDPSHEPPGSVERQSTRRQGSRCVAVDLVFSISSSAPCTSAASASCSCTFWRRRRSRSSSSFHAQRRSEGLVVASEAGFVATRRRVGSVENASCRRCHGFWPRTRKRRRRKY